ncbi:MAG: hypothetical protein ABIQ01_05765 [Pseudolysinimonas sp.]
MPYHGLEHEPRQPEEVIRFAKYIARPPRIVFRSTVHRDDAHLIDDLTVSDVRTVVLNPYWRPEIIEAGLEHLIDDSDARPADMPRPRAHMYDVMWRLAKALMLLAALATVGVVLVIIWRVTH